MAPLCIFWAVLKERNHELFDEEAQLDQDLKSSFLTNLLAWVKM